MSYSTPDIKSIAISELLSRLGPARAQLYVPGEGREQQPIGGTGGGQNLT